MGNELNHMINESFSKVTSNTLSSINHMTEAVSIINATKEEFESTGENQTNLNLMPNKKDPMDYVKVNEEKLQFKYLEKKTVKVYVLSLNETDLSVNNYFEDHPKFRCDKALYLKMIHIDLDPLSSAAISSTVDFSCVSYRHDGENRHFNGKYLTDTAIDIINDFSNDFLENLWLDCLCIPPTDLTLDYMFENMFYIYKASVVHYFWARNKESVLDASNRGWICQEMFYTTPSAFSINLIKDLPDDEELEYFNERMENKIKCEVTYHKIYAILDYGTKSFSDEKDRSIATLSPYCHLIKSFVKDEPPDQIKVKYLLNSECFENIKRLNNLPDVPTMSNYEINIFIGFKFRLVYIYFNHSQTIFSYSDLHYNFSQKIEDESLHSIIDLLKAKLIAEFKTFDLTTIKFLYRIVGFKLNSIEVTNQILCSFCLNF